MKEQLAAVDAFRKKMGMDDISVLDLSPDPVLQNLGRLLQEASTLASTVDTQLLIEETGELVEAIGDANPHEIYDAIGDLLYVVIGRALRYSIPIEEVFNRVHESNMLKKVSNERCSDKGEQWRPPNFEDLV